MIKTKVNCAVCQTIKAQPKDTGGRLAKRIYGSRHFTPSSSYNLSDIAREYKDKFSYESLLNHCKKHQLLTADDFAERHLRTAAKEAEKAILKQAVTSQQVWNDVIDRGMEDLKSGKMSLSANHLLGAARDKSNFELKHADQQIALMDMVFGFASGEQLPNGVREDEDEFIEGETVPEGASESAEEREVRSRTFYQSLAGDAPAPRTD